MRGRLVQTLSDRASSGVTELASAKSLLARGFRATAIGPTDVEHLSAVTAGTWTVGLVCLACIWLAPFFGASRLVRRLAPAVTGSPALLASVVLTLVFVTLTSEALGSVGQFRRWPLVAACLVVGAGAALAGRPPSRPDVRVKPGLATLMAVGLAVVVFARWAIESGASLRSGILGTDSLQYHLPFAATFAQSGWLSRLHYAWLDPVWTFYPYGSEIFHAIGMEAFGSDVISPVLNLGWLALAMLGAWCCGRRWGAAPLTLAMACIVLSLPVLTASQAGSADNDIVSLALLLSAVGLLFTVAETGGGYLLAALAAGLAAGTTLAALPAVAGLTAGVLLLDKRGISAMRRLWMLGLIVPGGYWYLRNLVRIGNPMPALKVGPLHLPAPAFPAVARYGFSVAHYLPDGWFWRDYVRPGVHAAFGPGWPFVAVLAVLGAAAPLSRRTDPLVRPVALGAAIAAAVYIVTPTSAYGPPHDPFLFAANLRLLLPSVAMFTVIAAVFLWGYRPRRLAARFSNDGVLEPVWVGVAGALSCVALVGSSGAYEQWGHNPLFASIGGAAALLGCAFGMSWRPFLRAVAGVTLLMMLVVAGLPVADSYLTHRYTAEGPIYHWARNLEGAKIGTIGFADQYPLFGLHLDNQVSYVGTVGAHGSFLLATSCAQWREDLSRGGYDYVVIGDNDWSLAPIPERTWTQSDPAARLVIATKSSAGPRGVVFRIVRGIDTTAGC